jgi:glycosyltransferase involved in cell wall biosynthesis
MKLVYLANCILPSRSANTIQITKTCDALARQGHDVILLVPDRPRAETNVADVYGFYDVDPSFRIAKVTRPPLSSLGTLLANYWMGHTAAGLDPDLVYGRTTVGCYAASLFGAPTVFESHSPVVESRFGRVEDFLFGRMIRRPSFRYLVVISSALRDYYRDAYPDLADRIVVARDAADPVDRTTDRSSPGGSDDRLQVGYVGHLYTGRGMGLIGDLATRRPECDFQIVGGDREDVETWRGRLGGADNVTFHGFVPPADLDRYRLAFDVQLAPYQWDLETNAGHNTVRWMSPLKIFEYMAAGRAIVASDMPAIREILTDGETALLCDPDDAGAWDAALSRLRDQPTLRRRLGERARDEFEAHYTYDERVRIALRQRAEADAVEARVP